ncbi:DUF1376 domain-containing protein [Sinorhizobium fredii]|uniref:YdaU family protein n=1 Tax=Rhizobium fredii TaxID=380 RepID=UPI003CE59980
MTHLPWMPVYIGDELAETSHLTAEEYGAYASLKMHLWQHGRLPCEDERLARIARCGADRWQSVRDALWNLFADDWRHPRLEALRVEAEETHRKRSEAGRKGGRPRREEKPGYKPGFSNEKAGPKHPQPQPQPQSHSYPEPPAPAQSPDSALEKEGLDTDTREAKRTIFTPLDRPSSPKQSAVILRGKGVPDASLSWAIEKHMAGELNEYTIEGLANGEVYDGAA